MRRKGNLSYIVAVLSIVLVSSCRVKMESISKSDVVEAENAAGESVTKAPEIIFLNYSIKKDSTGSPEVRFINQIVANGKLKNTFPEEAAALEGGLKCIALDASSRPIKSVTISNPLNKTVEYVDETGQLSKKEIELDSAEFSIRMQLDPGTESIAIEQLNQPTDGNAQLIVTKIR